MIPNHSSGDDYTRMAALGVTSYGQMTAGSYMYIGPQGIVHGTTITILGAGRRYLGGEGDSPLAGKVYVTSGLGGMSGAQGKASVIAGCVGVIAEINPAAARKRHEQGWVDEIHEDLDSLLSRIESAKKRREAVALGGGVAGEHGGLDSHFVDTWLSAQDVPFTVPDVLKLVERGRRAA